MESTLQLPELLLGRFGLSHFRLGQREAVVAALAGRDCVVVMPTGAGKSLCYQLPALAGQGLVIVVSPLIALMADQCKRVLDSGVPAVMLASGMADGHNERALGHIASGRAALVFVSPERFASPTFRRVLAKRRIALFVVDEAHCLAEWGDDFRPDYLRLSGVVKNLGRPPVMAATATATPQLSKEIARRLGLMNWVSIRCGFDRPNITFDVIPIEGRGTAQRKRALLVKVLADPVSLPAIVYCATRRETDGVVAMLCKAGVSAVGYHAGMSPAERWASQRAFMAGRARVVVATNAFGMGIDKADVRTVVHWTVPASIEAYYQEAGRAGRDGRPAKALLLAARVDLTRLVRLNSRRDLGVIDVENHLQWLRGEAHHGVLECPQPSERQRMLLSIAERAGALRTGSAGRGRMRLRLIGDLNREAAEWAIKTAQEHSWDSYRAIEQYVSNDECRRGQILKHFGDNQSPKPTVRCCDVCEDEPSLLTRPSVDARDLERLKRWRSENAGTQPPYMVATDASLREMLMCRPKDSRALLQIPGIGRVFCERHGDSILRLLASL